VADCTTRKQLEDDAEYKTELALYPVVVVVYRRFLPTTTIRKNYFATKTGR
jgi:hypothetical protein